MHVSLMMMHRRKVCLILLAGVAFAEPLSQGDRDRALSELHATRKLFLDIMAPLSEAQLKWKPAPDRWSIAEVAEHIAVAEETISKRALSGLQGPATPEKKKPNAAEIDAGIVKNVPIRDQKFQAPEALRPTNRFKTKEECVAFFKAARDKNLTYLRTTQDDLRSHFLVHPAMGEIDVYQWFLLMGAHTERHVNQIKEVMASSGFPVK